MKNKTLLIIGGIILLLGLMLMGTYNSLVTKEENTTTKMADISVQLQRRNDLIPNLVNTVKEYAEHEESVFAAVNEARQNMLNSNTVEEQANADAEITQALGRLLAVAEAYPDLKANTNFINLQDELAGTENRIATVRRDYNDAVKDYNTSIKTFPNNLMASMFGFEEKIYFETTEGATEVPNVDFE